MSNLLLGEIEGTGTDMYSQFIHKSRYSRWLDSEDRRESWAETTQRYIDFFRELYPDLESEIQDLAGHIQDHKVMPSMRALMAAGKALTKDHVAGFNCLAGETLVTTKEFGIVPIRELAGKSVHIVDGNGDWVEAPCKSYGTQDLYNVNFVSSGEPLSVAATANHRWVLVDGSVKTTSEFQSGDRTAVVNSPGESGVEYSWEVLGVTPTDRTEEVFCFEVPTTQSFLLHKNILTGNCSFVCMNHPRAFDELMYILMCGTGVGFSVERQHTNKLPTVSEDFHQTDSLIVVRDSKIGWATAFKELISLLYNGQIPKWDVSKVRQKGARLRTFGGRASGPEPLERLFRFVIQIFQNAAGRKLHSLEVHDICCKIAEIVVVGGVRRCLPAHTPVFTSAGPKPISEIRAGDMIVVGGKEHRVRDHGYSGEKKTLVFRHRFGTLECTPEHRVAVFDTVDSYMFKPASELRIGDRLVWDSVGISQGEPTSIPAFAEEMHFNSNAFKLPETVDPSLAWLIGLFQGDGCVNQRSLEISGNEDEIEVLEQAQYYFMQLFGLDSTVGSDSKGGKGIRLRLNSAPLARWFSKHIKQSSEPLSVPEFIQTSGPDVRGAYLAGLIDADGRRREDGCVDQATTVYEKFATQIQTLLATLGIAAPVYPGSAQRRRDAGENAQDFWTVRLPGRTNRSKWAEQIGCWTVTTKGDLEDKGGPFDFSYPMSMIGYKRGWKKSGSISVSALERRSEAFYPTPIVEISEGEVVPTYDISVEDVEQFNANGLIVHNSATISLSNLSDDRMRGAKSGQWWIENPQRRLANNSAALDERPEFGVFMEEWLSLYKSKSGERGIFSLAAARRQAARWGKRDPELIMGTNPCAEIILRDKGFCNLSEVIARPGDTVQDLKDKIRVAVIFGTLQSSLTKFRYLRASWRKNAEEERLLGVSITGIMDHPILGDHLNPDLPGILEELRDYTVEVNAEWAEKLGIEPSAALTTVKPSGTVSQLCNTASGIHPRFSNYYIRRVRIDSKDPIGQFLKDRGIPWEVENQNPETLVFSFPIENPIKNRPTAANMGAMAQLDLWMLYHEHWCHHKPSCTVYYTDAEFLAVGQWIWTNLDKCSGISFLPYSDHVYEQAPYEEISEEVYLELSDKFPTELNWKEMSQYETEDNTVGSQTLACSAGSCELVDLV